MKKTDELIGIYKQMSAEQLQDEVDSLFDMCFALLESQERDTIENFINPNVKLTISCEVIKDQNGIYYC
jgi:hypothetical protein